jgi:NitT/TauT family transport system permease protein
MITETQASASPARAHVASAGVFARSFRKPPSRRAYLSVAAASVAVTVLIWHMLVSFRIMPGEFVPTPVRVVVTGVEMFRSGGFLQDVMASAGRILVAFVISALFAIPLGLLMSSFKLSEALFEPLIDFIRYVPVPSLGPIFILWTGIGESSKLLVLFFGTFFQLVLFGDG